MRGGVERIALVAAGVDRHVVSILQHGRRRSSGRLEGDPPV
jgi:hypothetical protein